MLTVQFVSAKSTKAKAGWIRESAGAEWRYNFELRLILHFPHVMRTGIREKGEKTTH